MTLAVTSPAIADPPITTSRERRRDRHAGRRPDQVAGLHRIRILLADARRTVEAGWVQHGWFTVADRDGRERLVTAYNAHLYADRPVLATCLVGAVVEAGGGLGAVYTEPVQRSLDLTWHCLFADPRDRVRWCPAPPVRALHVRDLTRWNDWAGRTAGEVVGLLRRAEAAADAELARVGA